MTAHDSAAKTYKTLNDAGRSHDECLREAVDAALKEAAKVAEGKLWRHGKSEFSDGYNNACCAIANALRALSDGGQKND